MQWGRQEALRCPLCSNTTPTYLRSTGTQLLLSLAVSDDFYWLFIYPPSLPPSFLTLLPYFILSLHPSFSSPFLILSILLSFCPSLYLFISFDSHIFSFFLLSFLPSIFSFFPPFIPTFLSSSTLFFILQCFPSFVHPPVFPFLASFLSSFLLLLYP